MDVMSIFQTVKFYACTKCNRVNGFARIFFGQFKLRYDSLQVKRNVRVSVTCLFCLVRDASFSIICNLKKEKNFRSA